MQGGKGAIVTHHVARQVPRWGLGRACVLSPSLAAPFHLGLFANTK